MINNTYNNLRWLGAPSDTDIHNIYAIHKSIWMDTPIVAYMMYGSGRYTFKLKYLLIRKHLILIIDSHCKQINRKCIYSNFYLYATVL